LSREPNVVRSVLKENGEEKMRKAIAELDAEQRAALLCVVDFGMAICTSGLIVGLVKSVVDIVLGA
jgi:hypothetical protein